MPPVDAVGERTLTDLLAEQCARDPARTWLVFEDREGTVSEWSYGQFADDVARVAGGLRGLGVARGDRVLLHLRNCPEFLLTWFAAASIGAVMVPSNVANTAGEVAYLVERAGVAVAVVDPATVDVVAGAPGLTTLFVSGRGPAPGGTRPFSDLLEAAPAVRDPQVTSSDLHQILFTSGTTSKPKGVMVTHANALWSGIRMGLGMGLEPTDRCLTALPLFHVNAQSVTVLAALTAGASVVLLEAFEAARYLDQIRCHGATATSFVAAQSKALLAQPARDDDRDHGIRRTGHAINVTDAEKAEFEDRFGVAFINIYGLSEAAETVAMSPLHGPQRWPAVGLPALDRQVRLLTPEGEDAEVGEIGEILVHGVPGRTVMAGYFDDPEETARTLVDGWVHTGDLGRFDEHGYLYFVDRTKNIIKVAGQNVSTTEVEEAIAIHPAVVEAAVIAVPHPTRGEMGKAFVVLEPGAALDADAVVAHCAEHLARYKIPGEVEFLAALPRTSVGKLAKGELTAREKTREIV
ncbi:AMP-binding protein [Actinomycetospora endophytica]|uniref:AMP-binding protein n=1 Tax=Actinomycetospora endophytica TaxID=2291215 RepID=A0ABS8PAR7_9PSEU|nr:AMP-binding protein [Actinomycetospora endophytica]MCD2195347.1 AMP-binding protein [Actinomycetospora endophytica]